MSPPEQRNEGGTEPGTDGIRPPTPENGGTDNSLHSTSIDLSRSNYVVSFRSSVPVVPTCYILRSILCSKSVLLFQWVDPGLSGGKTFREGAWT